MFRLKIFKMSFLVMFCSLALNATGVTAQDTCIFPTVTEEVNFPEGWHDFLSELGLSLVCNNDGVTLGYGSTCDEVGSGCTVVLRMEITSGATIEPYEWTISGTGFYFDMGGGVPGYTISDVSANETVDICSATTACGTGKITVTDDWGNSAIGYIRSDSGKWTVCTTNCDWDYCSLNCQWTGDCSSGPEYIKDGHIIKYRLCTDGWGDRDLCYECYCDDGWGGTICPHDDDVPWPCGTNCNYLFHVYIYKWTCL